MDSVYIDNCSKQDHLTIPDNKKMASNLKIGKKSQKIWFGDLYLLNNPCIMTVAKSWTRCMPSN